MRRQRLECARTARVDTRQRIGEVVEPGELELAAQHRESCLDCRLEQAALDALVADGSSGALPELDDIAKQRMVDALMVASQPVAGASADPHRHLADTTPAAKSRAGWFAAAGIAAAAGLTLVIVWQAGVLSSGEQDSVQPVATSSASPIAGSELVVLGGEVRVGSTPAQKRVEIVDGGEIETGDGLAALGLPGGIAVWVGSNAILQVFERDARRHEVALERGEILVVVEPGRHRLPFVVATHQGLIEVRGTVFSVNAEETDVAVGLYRGAVELHRPGADPWLLSKGNAASLRAGQELRRISASETRAARRQLADLVESGLVSEQITLVETEHDPGGLAEASAAEESTPGALLEPEATERGIPTLQALRREAQAHRRAGRWKAAAESYRSILKDFSNSAEARTSLVALGQLELEKLGRPAEALKYFSRYLAGGGRGPLAQEALYGRARAFRALGRTGAERIDLQRFVAQFPRAIQAAKAKQRLAQLAQGAQ